MKDYSKEITAHLNSGAQRSLLFDGKGGFDGTMRTYDNRTFVYGRGGEVKSIIRTESSIHDLLGKWGL